MVEGYRPLAGVAGGFVLALAIVAVVSASQVVQPPGTQTVASTAAPAVAASGPQSSANNSAGRSSIQPRYNASTASTQASPGRSSIQNLAKLGGVPALVIIAPLLVGIVLGIGVHQLSARRIERED